MPPPAPYQSTVRTSFGIISPLSDWRDSIPDFLVRVGCPRVSRYRTRLHFIGPGLLMSLEPKIEAKTNRFDPSLYLIMMYILPEAS